MTPSRRVRSRSLLVDVLKAVSAQAIVLHHFALYGPMSDWARPLAPAMIDGFAEYGLLAVHVFFAVGGFLTARSLAPDGQARSFPTLQMIGNRLIRLLPAYWTALAIAVLAAALAARWADLAHAPPVPTVPIVIANALLLQDVLNMPALSAGFWYVAIDLQLFVLAVMLLGGLHTCGLAHRAIEMTALGAAASLLWFNRDANLDAWAPYFFGSYGLGMLAGLAVVSPLPRRRLALGFLATLLLVALTVQWRSRIAMAGLTAFVLAARGATSRSGAIGPLPALMAWLSDRSYALFLVHYPMCLLGNAAATRWLPHEPTVQAAALALTWLASMLASDGLYRSVERRVLNSRRLKTADSAASALRR